MRSDNAKKHEPTESQSRTGLDAYESMLSHPGPADRPNGRPSVDAATSNSAPIDAYLEFQNDAEDC